jgi:cell division ATPase FtsA
MRRVLLAAAHRDLVEPLLEAVEGAGLTAVSVDLTSTAVIRSLCNPAAGAPPSLERPEAIVAIGAGLTTVIVHEGGVPHFVRTIADGGDSITEAIAGALDMPIDDAESLKRHLDEPGPQIRTATMAASEASTSLVGEIRSSIEYYSTLPGRSEIRKVTITGGGSRLSGLLERLQQNLRAEVIPGNSLSLVDCSGLHLSDEEIFQRDPLVSVVLGLALPERSGVKPLDLLPPEIVKQRKAARTDRLVVSAAILIVLALAGLGVMRYLAVNTAQSASNQVQANLTSTKLQISRYDLVAKQYGQIKTEEAQLTPLVSAEVNWPLVLQVLARNTPRGGIVTALGGTASPPAVATAVPVSTTAANVAAVTAPQDTQIASLTLSVYAPRNLPYFQIWVNQLVKSHALQLTSWSGFVAGTSGQITYSAVLSVLGTIHSSRLHEFEVVK